MERHRHAARGEDFDYPPMIMESGGFSPTPHPPPWLGPPPPYEVAIKTTCSSTHLRRAYSDTHLASEPLFGQSREISFEVWWLGILLRLCCSFLFIVTNFFTHLKHGSFLVLACFLQVSCNLKLCNDAKVKCIESIYKRGWRDATNWFAKSHFEASTLAQRAQIICLKCTKRHKTS